MTRLLGLVSFRVYPTHMGGQKGVALFYEYLQQYLSVILAGSVDNVPTEKLKMERLLFPNKKMYLNASKLGELRQLVLNNNVDVVMAEHSYTGWLAARLKKKTGRPFIIHSHNIESRRFHKMNKWWWKWYQTYEKNIHRKADFNFFISREDLDFAVDEFGLDPSKCEVVTYGVEDIAIEKDRKKLRRALDVDENKTVLLFNGTLDYEPNYEAVQIIIDQLIPLLRTKLENYQILITGNRAPKELAQKMIAADHLDYLGYVDDVNAYYQCADIFINPVANDSGVKTKLIEAMANHCTTVSTVSGASGIQKELCGQKLHLVKDGDWNAFAEEILAAISLPAMNTPPSFFEAYSWKTITAKAAKRIESLVK